MPRRFGPTLAAGVAVEEQDGDKTLAPAPTGIVFYAGKLRKGTPNTLIHAPTRGDMLKKVGGYVDGSEVPDAAFDFWNLGKGAGELFFQRITDGTEVKASETFFSRHVGGTGGAFIGVVDQGNGYDELKRPICSVAAKNGGRWGGRIATLAAKVTDEATDITATTVDTGITMLVDQWKGATLTLDGVTTKTYTVTGNDAAGVLSVASDEDMAADLAAGDDPTNDAFSLALDTEIQAFPTSAAGTRRALSVLWKDGLENETDLFGLEVFEDEAKVRDFPNLSLDSASKWYAPNVINRDTSNFWIDFTDLWNGAGTVTSKIRPGNFFGEALNWASNVVTVKIVHTKSITSTNANVGWVDRITLPSVHSGVADLVRKQRLTITFTGATAFTVTSDADEGADLQDLGTGTVGTAYVPDTGKPYTPGFVVQRGPQAWTTGDVIVLDVLPLPVDLDGEGLLAGYLFPDVDTDSRKKIAIKSNTVNTITLVTAPDPVPTEASAAGAENFSTGTLTFPITLGNTTIDLCHSFVGRVSLTVAAGPHATAAALAGVINAAWQAATSSTGDIVTNVGNSLRFHVDDSGIDTNVGLDSFLVVNATNADLNLSPGDHVAGTPGAKWRAQVRTELRGGYDGEDPDATDFLAAAADAPTSMLARFFGLNKGLVKVATPGQTDTSIQQAWRDLAAFFGYQYRYELPSGTDDDSAAVAQINDTLGRNDFAVAAYPSYAYVPNPQGNGTVLRTLTGAIHGREALVAKNWSGYHKAAAGIDVTLPNIVELPTGDRILNEEILNPAGLQIIKKTRGNFVIWGDRTCALDPAWTWKHQRELISHYERQLLEGMDWIIFAINDPLTQGDAITTLTAFFLPEWQKRALRGETFKDACLIKIDDSNNTNLTRAAGDLNADIRLRLADTVERLVLRIGKAGIFEDLG